MGREIRVIEVEKEPLESPTPIEVPIPVKGESIPLTEVPIE